MLAYDVRKRTTSLIPFVVLNAYLVITPALFIWRGNISAVEAWGRALKIGVTCGSVAGMVVLVSLHIYAVDVISILRYGVQSGFGENGFVAGI